MKDPVIDSIDGVNLLRSYILHVRIVQDNLMRIRQEIELRGQRHDNSKMTSDEFGGFCRINKAAREHPFGSPEYKDGLAREYEVIDIHYSRNSHHPENHNDPDRLMGWLDIIEMVCDWYGAYIAYGSQGTWDENMQRQKERYSGSLNQNQWWLIDEVAGFLAE